uniref:Nudix hydrolase domain-containing protein n=1 Tax=Polytomella parva TaxID=51329 RepID=A0A7S0UQK8_9CHLO|mmetsp:Transcript_11132/g.20137  ORF Transcript_11132/g.20137 Transcript_11132/m.20137 type:complete len:273 (+) Transcript_11132:87-905(+)
MLSLTSFNKLKFFSDQRHKKQNTSFSSNRIPIASRNILFLSSLFQRPGSSFSNFSISKMSSTSNKNHYPYDMKNLSPHLTIKDAIDRHGPKFEEFPLDSPSPFVKPRKVLYDFDGKQRRWDLIEAHPSVSVILYHRDLDSWLLVRQFRPPVYAVSLREARAADPSAPAPPFSAGFTYELCAGLVDKAKLSLAEICREEILEECGFDVPLSSIRYVSTATSATGCMGAKHDIFFAEVTNGMQSGEPGVGGGWPSMESASRFWLYPGVELWTSS